jgi:hypothetical protein
MDVVTGGSTPQERASSFPCDALGFAYDVALYRAITIAAPPALVFRWLAQLRVAPYSYDLIDNFGRRSPPLLTPGLDALAVGQRIMTIFRVAGFERGRSLTITLNSGAYEALFGALAGSLRVDPQGDGSRLIAKVLLRYPKGAYGRVLATVLPTLDFIMFRKQLLTLKTYAERDAAAARYRASA